MRARKLLNRLGHEDTHEAKEKPPRLKAGVRNKLNTRITKLLKPTYFDKIPLQLIFDILEEFYVVPLQEDNTPWDGFLLGRQGRTSIALAPKSSEVNDGALTFYTPFVNASLVITWYKMQTGRYEVVAYVS